MSASPEISESGRMLPAELVAPGTPIAGVRERYERGPAAFPEEPRPRGRPRKLTKHYLRELLAQDRAARDWYLSVFGEPPSSHFLLYEQLWAHDLHSRGERPGRVEEPDFQGAIKTLRNELGIARRFFGTEPE